MYFERGEVIIPGCDVGAPRLVRRQAKGIARRYAFFMLEFLCFGMKTDELSKKSGFEYVINRL